MLLFRPELPKKKKGSLAYQKIVASCFFFQNEKSRKKFVITMELYLKNSRKKVYLCERFLIKNFTEKVVHIMMTDFNCQRQFFQQISKIK